MGVGIVVDSVCDLPRAIIDRFGIEILPVALHFGDNVFEDMRDPEAAQAFYRDYLSERNIDFRTRALDVETMTQLFLDRFVLKYSKVLVIACASSRSRLFKNATQASYALLKLQRHRRQAAGLPGSFALRIVDSKSLYAGEAIVAHEAVRMADDESQGLEHMRQSLEELGDKVVTYLVPDDPFYLRFRAREKGERSIGAVGYQVARMFDLKPVVRFTQGRSGVVSRPQGFESALGFVFDAARDAISYGLAKPLIAMSYAGDPARMRERDTYKSFAAFAESQGVELTLAVMSVTSGINVGPGAFSLAFAK
ncbi:MAG: fatty acid-binding protein DegV [Gammaproteobacteria bacterium]|nr:fatty acid-binding protein DegV [Gammaproteobacteria bacterium]